MWCRLNTQLHQCVLIQSSLLYDLIKKYGYSVVKKNNKYYIARTSNDISYMYKKQTYENIYNIVISLNKHNMKILGLLLLSQVCRDIVNNNLQNIFIDTGFFEKYKNILI